MAVYRINQGKTNNFDLLKKGWGELTQLSVGVPRS